MYDGIWYLLIDIRIDIRLTLLKVDEIISPRLIDEKLS